MKFLLAIGLVVLMSISRSTSMQSVVDHVQYFYRSIGDDQVSKSQEIAPLPNEVGYGGATRLKNHVKGPADLGIYYINSAGLSCGGLKTNQCSTSCGALGYPVYWCYPKVCFCHYGTTPEELQENNEIDVPQLR